MTLTASEVGSLTKAIDRWEYAEYAFTALVAIACFGEYVADFTEWWKRGKAWSWFGDVEHRKDRVAKFSTLVLIGALAGELVCVVRTNQLSGTLVGALADRSEEAFTKSGDAVKNADTAMSRSGSAIQESLIAANKSTQATKDASSALGVAGETRREADSFERDIVSAKEQAAAAESHLADALKRATEATAALERMKSPRRLNHISELIATLGAFKGTEYTFSAVFADEESLLLLKTIDDVLQRSEWKRGKPVGGFPAINVFGNENPFGVPVALTDGIRITVDSPETLPESLALDKLPSPVKESVALNVALSSSLSPPESPAPLVNVSKGESKTIRISIGKKPQ